MNLHEALTASWVSPGGYRGARRGDLRAYQDPQGRISLWKTQRGMEWSYTSMLPKVAPLLGWKPWTENGGNR